MRTAARMADVALGGDDEIEAAVGANGAGALLDLGVRHVAQKHGPDGVTAALGRRHAARVAGHPVEVVNGLGAGDAFAAAFGWRLLRGDAPAAAAEFGQPGRRPCRRPAGLLDRDARGGDLQ